MELECRRTYCATTFGKQDRLGKIMQQRELLALSAHSASVRWRISAFVHHSLCRLESLALKLVCAPMQTRRTLTSAMNVLRWKIWRKAFPSGQLSQHNSSPMRF